MPSPTPEILTVPEAAEYLRIGRSAAYVLARRWLDTDGAAGIPCVTLGSRMRVPRAALDRMLGIGPATQEGENAPEVTYHR